MTEGDADYLRRELARVRGLLMPWGPYRGIDVNDIPNRYLVACLGWERLSAGLRSLILEVLHRRRETFWAVRAARTTALRAALDAGR